MSINLPGPKSTAAPAPHIDAQVQQFRAAIDDATRTPTFHRDNTPLPVVGPTPPVEQPGRPSMSQKATDASVLMLAGGATTVMVSGSAAGLMYFSQFADPVACAIVFGAPVALVVALTRLVARAGAAKAQVDAVRPEIHYNGHVTVDQRAINTTTRGLIANTRNQLPR
ncbi:hypothetical protein pZL12.70c [Streptomyces phage ZL12]|uniref:Uncharacterized protein n=1 Tax=Streptomyces phage ZL12 TaxID=2570911 RepID=D0UWH5_9CAUD|nr:hypothetical protein QEH43_gp070 [Streptomyces phage ZL12]ACX71147.1 hypothetical protein pZL12.70c [Streptomyces phage ZL12]